jgi:hypothetical protein
MANLTFCIRAHKQVPPERERIALSGRKPKQYRISEFSLESKTFGIYFGAPAILPLPPSARRGIMWNDLGVVSQVAVGSVGEERW